MILLNILPSAAVDERLAWATDVLPSYTREQRVCLREGPRAAYGVNWMTDNAGFARLRTRAAWQSRDEYGLPAWWEMSEPLNITQSDTSITVDTTQADYRDWVVILDGTKIEALPLSAVHAGSLDLVTPAAKNYVNVRVAPLRVCEAPRGFDFDRSGKNVEVSASLTCAINPDVGNDPNPVHEGYPVLLARSSRSGSFSETDLRQLNQIDSVTGSPYSFPVRGVMDKGRTVASFAQGRPAKWALRQWVHARRGRLRAFWLPTWNADMRPSSPVSPSDTTITIHNEVWREAGVKCILVESNDGTQVIRKVTGITLSGANEIVSLSSQLGVSSVRLVSVVDLVRLDQDTVTLKHQPNEITTFSAPCVEVPA